MAKNSDSSRTQQTAQTIRATGDLSPSRRHTVIDNNVNGKNTTRK